MELTPTYKWPPRTIERFHGLRRPDRAVPAFRPASSLLPKIQAFNPLHRSGLKELRGYTNWETAPPELPGTLPETTRCACLTGTIQLLGLGRSASHAVEEAQAEAVPRRVRGEGGCPRGDRYTSAHARRTGRQEAEIQGREAQANAQQAAGRRGGVGRRLPGAGFSSFCGQSDSLL
jgi:hypothetical protein